MNIMGPCVERGNYRYFLIRNADEWQVSLRTLETVATNWRVFSSDCRGLRWIGKVMTCNMLRISCLGDIHLKFNLNAFNTHLVIRLKFALPCKDSKKHDLTIFIGFLKKQVIIYQHRFCTHCLQGAGLPWEEGVRDFICLLKVLTSSDVQVFNDVFLRC